MVSQEKEHRGFWFTRRGMDTSFEFVNKNDNVAGSCHVCLGQDYAIKATFRYGTAQKSGANAA